MGGVTSAFKVLVGFSILLIFRGLVLYGLEALVTVVNRPLRVVGFYGLQGFRVLRLQPSRV